jgi:hypothetical protein
MTDLQLAQAMAESKDTIINGISQVDQGRRNVELIQAEIAKRTPKVEVKKDESVGTV